MILKRLVEFVGSIVYDGLSNSSSSRSDSYAVLSARFDSCGDSKFLEINLRSSGDHLGCLII